MKTAIFLLIFTVSLAHSQTSTKCDFEITCENFALAFSSPSKECVEDDGVIHFKTGDTKSKLEIKESWFYEIANVGDVPSKCKSTHYESYPAYDVNDLKLIFIRKNNRPSIDKIIAILIEPKTGKIVDSAEIGTYMRNTLGIMKTKQGFKIQMVKSFNKKMNCDCDAGFVEGMREISVKGRKIGLKWL